MKANAGTTSAATRISIIRPGIPLRRVARRLAFLLIRSGLAVRLAAALGGFDRPLSIRFRGWLAGVTRRHDDHTDFWDGAVKRYPSDSPIVRSKIDAALRAGRTTEAEAALVLLVSSGKATAADCRFVIGLSNADLRGGDHARIRSRVRRFLGGLRGKPDYRIAATRLSRVVFAHFPRKERTTAPRVLRARFLKILGRSETKRIPKALLFRVAACEATLEACYPPCLFYTDVLQEQRESFIWLVRERLARGQPFSFVRAGDGEAACLAYEPRLARYAAADARDRERIWWGEPLNAHLRAELAPRIARAIWDADCIGIPTVARYLRELNLVREDSLEMSLTGRGLRAVLYSSECLPELRTPGLPAPMLVSCHVHQDLALWNGYAALLDGVKELVLLSCHPDLADCVRERFGVSIARNILLPPDRVSAPLLKRRSAETRDLPDILDSVLDEIGDLPRGRLVLVGAGYPGKWLVSEARRRGGIALDLGSIFDYWLGLNTRSYLDLDPQ